MTYLLSLQDILPNILFLKDTLGDCVSRSLTRAVSKLDNRGFEITEFGDFVGYLVEFFIIWYLFSSDFVLDCRFLIYHGGSL